MHDYYPAIILESILREVRWEGVDWLHLDQDCEHGNEPLTVIKGRKFVD